MANLLNSDPLQPLSNAFDTQTMAQPIGETSVATSPPVGVTTSSPVVVTSETPVTSAVVPTTTSTTPVVISTTRIPATTPIVQTTPTTSPTTSAVVVVPTTSIISLTPTTSTSSIPTTTPTSTSTSTSTSSSKTSTQILTITSTQPHPSLITNVTASTASSITHVSSAAASSSQKGGVAHTGLPLGAFVGIIIGCAAVIAVIGLIVTRSIRKKGRARRTANRSSMFEPWPAPVPVSMEDESFEKPSSYPMREAPSYPPEPAQELGCADYPQHPDHQLYPDDQSYPAQAYPAYQESLAPPSEAAPLVGIHDGMMVRVKIGFVRSLEDELAVLSGQQLYLHTAYDDGWSLCEDQNQSRGVVPLSCLEPWQEGHTLMPRSNTDQSLSGRSARRSSLYQTAPTAGAYMNVP